MLSPEALAPALASFLAGREACSSALYLDRALTVIDADAALAAHGVEVGATMESVVGSRLLDAGLRTLAENTFDGVSGAMDVQVAFEPEPSQLTLSAWALPGHQNMLITVEDTSPALRIAEERQLTLDVIRTMHLPSDLRDLLRDLVRLIRHQTGCDAVGIRLRDGEDYPYYETSGFSDEFLLKERSVCARDARGQVRRDAAGRPLLECMCGNILQGRTDPSKPFFTSRGSFWSNCTTALLASTTEADRQSETRNRCNGSGYESVALFPLRVGGETFGLLQINDKRRDRFSPQSLEMLEHLADSLAVGLLQRQTDSKLHDSLREKEVLLREVHHRVKNNLQTLASMLRLQSRKTTDPGVQDALQDFQTRIMAFASVHDQLYRAKDLAHVDLAEYATRLVDHVRSLHLGGHVPVRVSTSFDADMIVGLDESVSLGLIVCELVTNALQHAFPGNRAGNVSVAIRRAEPSGFRLEVHDDGVGIPAGIEHLERRATFGLELVEVLTRQLHGELHVDRVGGTQFTVHVPAGASAEALT